VLRIGVTVDCRCRDRGTVDDDDTAVVVAGTGVTIGESTASVAAGTVWYKAIDACAWIGDSNASCWRIRVAACR
jgi:hypothetical protein